MRVDVRDLVFLAGLACVGAGAALVSPPLGLLAVGLVLLACWTLSYRAPRR